MRHTILALLLVVSWFASRAGNALVVSDVQGSPNEIVEISVSLSNTDQIVALEVIIPLNNYLKYVNGSCALSQNHSDNYSLNSAMVEGSLRTYIYSIDKTPLSCSGESLFSFKLKLGNTPQTFSLVPAVVLSDKDGKAVDVSVTNGKVSILAPQLTIITSEIDYGRCPIFGSYTKTITLQNSGTSDLSISDIFCSTDRLSPSDTQLVLPSGQSKNVTLTFTPINRGEVSETVTIDSNDPIQFQTIAVRATPYFVNELHVGNGAGSAGEEVEIELHMNNMEPIIAAQWSFSLPIGLAYVEGSFKNADRSANHQALSVQVGGKVTMYLYSSSNTAIDGTEGKIGSFKVKLQGTSGKYSINPQEVVLGNINVENMVSATSAGQVVISSPIIRGNTELDFGNLPLDGDLSRSFTIKNTGSESLEINKIVMIDEGFSVIDELPFVISPNSNRNITVKCDGTVAGDYSTSMNIYNNDPETRVLGVNLTCSLYEPNTIGLSGSVDNDNKTVTAIVSLDNYSEIISAQMDIHFVSGVSVLGGQVVLSSRTNGHSSYVSKIGDKDFRVALYNLNNTPISEHEGEIFSLPFTIPEGVDFNQQSITVDNIVLGNKETKNKATEQNEAQWIALKRLHVEAFSNNDSQGTITVEGVENGYTSYGSSVKFIAIAKGGIVFGGWSDGETIVSNEPEYEIEAKEDMSLTALFLCNPQKLTYYVDGELFYETLVEANSPITPIAEPARDGYTFGGWQGLPLIMPSNDVEVNGYYRVNGVVLMETSVSIEGGCSHALTALVSATNEPYNKIEWHSSNPQVASVSTGGVVLGIRRGKTTITGHTTDGSNLEITCSVTVLSDAELPTPFEFNYNARDYNEQQKLIPNHKMAELKDYNLRLQRHTPTYHDGCYLNISGSCTGYIDKWQPESTQSGAYFYRSGNDCMTIICKVSPQLGTGTSDLVCNRGNGYNYMMRVGDNNSFYLHTQTAYSANRSLELSSSDTQILAIRVDGVRDFILLENLTTGDMKKISNVNWGAANNIFNLFSNNVDTNECFLGSFYWVYYSFEYLSDEEIQSVVVYNEPQTYASIPGDINNDGDVTIGDVACAVNQLQKSDVDYLGTLDVNEDNLFDQDDVVTLADIILGRPIQISSLAFSESSIQMKKDEEYQLLVKAKPTIASLADLTWSSSNEQIATVDNNGVVKALLSGEADIVVSTKQGLTASCHIKVFDHQVLQYIENTGGATINLDYVFTPSTQIEFKLAVTKSNGGIILGELDNDDDHDLRFFPYLGSRVYFDLGSNRVFAILNNATLSAANVYEIGNFYIKKSGDVICSDTPMSFARTHPLTLFAESGDRGKIYYLKIYEGGYLVKSFVPVMFDGQYCLYEKLECKYYKAVNSSCLTGAE